MGDSAPDLYSRLMPQSPANTVAQCRACGAELPLDAEFCSQCGRKAHAALLPTEPLPSPGPLLSTRPLSGVPQLEKTQPQVNADPLIGATVADRYHILSMIGRGGMGVVYKVEHAKIGKIMALKLLTGELARNKDTVQRFKREALMVSKLSHPNTVQVFDYGSADGLTYLAMEYLSGQDLGDLVENHGPLPFSQIAKIVIQVCGALREAHGVGMVHRDLKPENIFLTRGARGEETVKVLDFGLAKLQERRDHQITMTGNIVGTPYYMPPEQVRGEEVDARSDIYALCAVMYTCLTATHLFEAPNHVGVLTKQVKERPQPPHERVPKLNIRESVSRLILKGLEKDPDDRYQTVAELEDALRSQLHDTSQVSLPLPESGTFRTPDDESMANRDEVFAYEKSLQRRADLTKFIAIVALSALGYGAYALYERAHRPPEFSGMEQEPNHDVNTATVVPFGATVSGKLGKRINEGRGDQDNFSLLVPGSAERTTTTLSLTSLPNMKTCAYLFASGSESPLASYCSGAPGVDLRIEQLSLRPGRYLIAIKQDLGRQEDEPGYIYENVSDEYHLRLEKRDLDSTFEVEPNSDKRDSNVLVLSDTQMSAKISGKLNFTRDEDTVCVTGSGSGRLIVTDAKGGARPISAALELTPLGGPNDKIPVRIHAGRSGFEITERDQPSPYSGPRVDFETEPCVTLTLVPNPLAPTPHPLIAPASDHEWQLEAVREDPISEPDF